MFDQFEWDLNNKDFTPEQFARSLCAELGLGYEFIVLIAHSIREQIYFYKSAYAKNRKVKHKLYCANYLGTCIILSKTFSNHS